MAFLPSFTFDANDTNPEELARRRALALQMLQGATSGPVASNIGEGLAQLGRALAGRMQLGKVDAAEKKARGDAYGMLGASGLFGTPAAPSPDTMVAPGGAGGGGGGGRDAADWLAYDNKGAIRNQPLDPNLVKAMGFLPDMGVSMRVFSGGQDATGGRRTGSHRHDHGKSGDVFFYKDGRKLDWGSKADLPLFQEIVRRAKANGVTGFGAGPGYMQQGSMHLGFGSPAVWGAGGNGANAPDWLRSAFAGKVPPQAVQQAASMPVQQTDRGVPPAPGAWARMAGSAAGSGVPIPAPAPAPTIVPASAPPPAAAPAMTGGAISPYQRQMMNALEKGSAVEARPGTMQAAMGRAPGGFGGFPAPAAAMALAAPQMPPAAPPMTPATGAPPPAAQMAPAGGSRLQAIQQMMMDPRYVWLDDSQKKMIEMQFQLELQKANPDPMAALQLQKAQLEIDQMTKPQPGFRTMSQAEKIAAGIDPNIPAQQGPNGEIKVVSGAAPDPVKPNMQQVELPNGQKIPVDMNNPPAWFKEYQTTGKVPPSFGGAAAPPAKPEDVLKLRKDYNSQPGVSGYATVLPVIGSMVKSIDDPTAIADLDFVYGLAKMLDPTSVVRESEAGMVVDSQGIAPQFLGQLNKYATGQQAMSRDVRINLVKLAMRRAGEMRNLAATEYGQYKTMMEAQGMDPSIYLPPVADLPAMPGDPKLPPATPYAPPAASAPPVGGSMAPGIGNPAGKGDKGMGTPGAYSMDNPPPTWIKDWPFMGPEAKQKVLDFENGKAGQ